MSWGPAYWRFIHYFALNNKDRELLSLLPSFIPCEECKSEWEAPQDGEDLVQWSLRLHNKVNAKLGKWDKWDMTDYNIAHKNTCDYCNEQEYIHFFPWTFIHTIASFDGKEGFDGKVLSFLMRFNDTYPCVRCRGRLLFIDFEDGETLLDWTVRHHSRMNQERGLPPYVHPSTTVNQTTNGCDGCETDSTATALAEAATAAVGTVTLTQQQ